jgi:hypothetical protein
MTAKRPPMRRKCAWCKSPFRPNRSDAGFCGGLCRQAAHRKRKKVVDARAEAEALFRIAKNAHEGRRELEEYQSDVVRLYGVKGVELIATTKGILAAETIPGALAAMRSRRSAGDLGLFSYYRETTCQPGDVTAMIRLAPGAPFRYREAERDFIAAMSGQVAAISLFTCDWDYFEQSLLGPPTPLPTYWAERAEAENWTNDGDYVSGETAEDLLAGGGYQVEKP